MKKNNITLLPYTEVDGIRTAADSDIKRLFARTVEDGSDKIVFYEGTIKTVCDFLAMAKSGNVLFYIVLIGVDTVGYVWVNRLENKTAHFHFCSFKEYWGKNEEMGRHILTTILGWKNKEGRYMLDLLIGYIPAWNKRAIAFSLKCGGKSAGTIPNAIWNGETQKSEDAVFIYYTRGHDDLPG
ncbi:MAG: hypothetical protein DRH26_00105 [Deltaproteobacteria bacterium]|nr:MAG: hypothetical protein DRH26_00105 [Deltaproteobacteria bacterium]